MDRIIEKIEWVMDLGGTKKDIIFLVCSGISLLVSIFNLFSLPVDAAWAAIILCGIPIITEAVIGLVTAFDIKADVLVSLALVASLYIGEVFAAGEIAFIMQIGAFLEELTVAKARAGIEKLVHLTPQTARKLSEGTENIIPAEEVKIDDILRVLPGETIPVDGVITTGETAVNQAVMTGESLPADKTVGDEVFSGTVNQFGSFEMRAVKVGEDSSIQRMIRLVQSADAGKAKIVGIADRWATWIVLAALSAAIVTGLMSGEAIRAVTILVVFCPCALVLATPTAIMAAIGNAAKHGFLVREGDALERLAGVSKITFDKTGTLTCGTPQVVAVKTLSGYSEKEIYAYAAAAEQFSEHPLGKAIVHCFDEHMSEAKDFVMIPGQGVSAVIEGKTVLAGNEKLLKRHSILMNKYEEKRQDIREGTIIYVAVESCLAGYMILADTLRKESIQTIKRLQAFGAEPVLLTGDNQRTADAIAEQLHISDVRAECMPEDKLKQIQIFQEEGNHVCMIGDGINDAPALKKADVGIAMGGIGSDIAVDAADIVLVDDDIKELPHLVKLSKKMMTVIKLNLTFSMGLNFLAVILAITGLLSPVAGALVHNAGSVLVIIHSALLLHKKYE